MTMCVQVQTIKPLIGNFRISLRWHFATTEASGENLVHSDAVVLNSSMGITLSNNLINLGYLGEFCV